MGLFSKFFKKKDYITDSLEKTNSKVQRVSETEVSNMIENMSFFMAVQDIFTITGRGLILTGKIEKGSLKIGDSIKIIFFGNIHTAKVKNIEVSRKLLNEASAGKNVGLLVDGVKADQIGNGSIVLAH